ncbi:hypothetical protein D3C83_41390 [compost metagenome]
MILGGGTIQLVDRRGHVVYRRGVDAHDTRRVHLEARSELESGNALFINGHKVQAVGRDLQRDLLERTTVAA